jgi:hypothetical protein
MLINIGTFCDQVVSCYRNDQYSLLMFLSGVYSKNKFNFLCVQNFLDLGKKENMETMFDTVPYTEVWEVNRHPNFIVMYPYETSKHLADIDDSEYDNDGFMLNYENSSDNLWPEPLTSRNAKAELRYNIPAFGVSYGKMYQSYFTDVDISMDSPTVTEQSIKAQFDIACKFNEGEQTGDRSKMFIYGQDLYSIYSNNSYTCNVTMMGCAWVQPLMYFVLTNIPMFRGTYLIQRVTHHIEPGNMVTKFMGVRMSNVCTRIVRDGALRAKNDQTGEGETNDDSPEIRERLASIDNDCPYKEYPLTGGKDDASTDVKLSGGEKEKAKSLMGSLISLGYTTAAAAGIVGNMWEESNFIENNLIVDSNGYKSGGLCMWNATNLCDLVKGNPYGTEQSKACSKNITKEQMPNAGKQISFLHNSIINSYKKIPNYNKKTNYQYWKQFPGKNLKDLLNNASTPAEAAKIFAAVYERCSKCMQGISDNDLRINKAKAYFNNYNNNVQKKDPTLSGNEDKHVSDLAVGFLNALNQTAAASSNKVSIGSDASKSKGDTIYITGQGDNFSRVLDMIINTYSSKVDSVNWVLPGSGENYNSVPKAYLVHVKEGAGSTKISVTSENNPDTPVKGPIPVSNGGETSGIHDNFCKAIVKKYKSNTPQLRSDTNNQFGEEKDYNYFFDERYKIQKCNDAMENQNSNRSSSNAGGGNQSSQNDNVAEKQNESGYINDWNVGLYVQKLHYWQKNVCEALGKTRENKPTYKGCHMCTAAINRALSDSGLGRRYWGGEPWNVYDNMKSKGSRFYEVTGGTSSSKSEFNFGQAPQKGDVCVMWQVGRKKPRHTCSFDGSAWYSDVVQTMCNVYTGSNQFKIEWHLFRYK